MVGAGAGAEPEAAAGTAGRRGGNQRWSAVVWCKLVVSCTSVSGERRESSVVYLAAAFHTLRKESSEGVGGCVGVWGGGEVCAKEGGMRGEEEAGRGKRVASGHVWGRAGQGADSRCVRAREVCAGLCRGR